MFWGVRTKKKACMVTHLEDCSRNFGIRESPKMFVRTVHGSKQFKAGLKRYSALMEATFDL